MEPIEREALLDIAEQQGHVTVDDIVNLPTIDPIKAAGGCYCRECRRCDGFPGPDIEKDEVGICHIDMTTVPPYGFCKWGVPKEARP